MTTKDTGGPAYPTTAFNHAGRIIPGSDGMTLRDAFALAALPEVLREWRKDREENGDDADFAPDAKLVATDCYIVADAMLEARKQ